MQTYRIYFWAASSIIGRDDFAAEDDAQALGVADLLWDACCDCCETFDLWEGVRNICCDRQPSPHAMSLAVITERAQACVAEREEAIQQGKWSISRSQRLLERMDEWRSTARYRHV